MKPAKIKRFAAVLLFGIGLTSGLPGASEKGQAPDWAYGYLKALGPTDGVAPPCPAAAKPFPDCAYPGAPVPDDGIKRELSGAARQIHPQ
jgi:hypothetical protein